jgi:hypothetical protein
MWDVRDGLDEMWCEDDWEDDNVWEDVVVVGEKFAVGVVNVVGEGDVAWENVVIWADFVVGEDIVVEMWDVTGDLVTIVEVECGEASIEAEVESSGDKGSLEGGLCMLSACEMTGEEEAEKEGDVTGVGNKVEETCEELEVEDDGTR